MSVQIRQYRHGDEKFIEPVEDITSLHPDIIKRAWDDIVRPEWSWTGLSSDGRILVIGGIVPLEKNSALTWLIISKKKTTDILRILKKGFRLFDSYNFDNWYACIKDGFEQGCRIAKYLGFKNTKTIIKSYLLYENKRR